MHFKVRYGIFFIPILALVLSLLLTTQVARAVVDLIYFNATGENGQVTLVWKTSSEIDNTGFYINRSNSLSSNYQRIFVWMSGALEPQDFIPSAGAEIEYKAVDINVLRGSTYYYWLEAVGPAGSQFFGPISAVPGLALTPTQTSTTPADFTRTPTSSPTSTEISNNFTETATATKTQTRTPTVSRTPTRRPTRTRTPTLRPANTSTPRPPVPRTATPSPSPTVTRTITPTPTDTSTLMPLPQLTLLFPAFTPTDSPTPSQTATPTQKAGVLPISAGGNRIPPNIGLLGGLIVAIWLLLGGFLIFYLRKIGQ